LKASLINPEKSELVIETNEIARELFGEHEKNLKIINSILEVEIFTRGNILSISGNHRNINDAKILIQQLIELVKRGISLTRSDIELSARLIQEDNTISLIELFTDTVIVSNRHRRIIPRSKNQKKYLEAIRNYDIVFGIGPAGTGKTYLAMAMAIQSLLNKKVDRIILTRPAVEAGEKLGFLPGDIAEKVNPYLRPLYDALYDMIDFDRAQRLIERSDIEVAPLAFMRGRTLHSSFIILDEAQNTTSEQMKMFITRMGLNSKIVITGDITQIDLPNGKKSGLVEAHNILRDIEGIAFIYFDEHDVVRHHLVQKIIKAYEKKQEQ
jgi:phosphate starvation-inducible PhoH-like protein